MIKLTLKQKNIMQDTATKNIQVGLENFKVKYFYQTENKILKSVEIRDVHDSQGFKLNLAVLQRDGILTRIHAKVESELQERLSK